MVRMAADRMLGIVGGVSPESTLDYYRRLIDRHRARRTDVSYPRILVNSVDGGKLLGPMLGGDWAPTIRAFRVAIDQLAAGGAGLALIASVAMHTVFDDVAPGSPIPLLHIVEAIVVDARRRGIVRPGLIATRIATEGEFFARPFTEAGIELVRPDPADVDWIHEHYFAELVKGQFRKETRDHIVSIISALRDSHRIDGVILGGTELPILLREPAYAGVPVLDVTAIHVEAALDWLLGESPR